ncbi:type II/IV secretion system ATPase subunit [Pyrodictium abyssi]|uniref:Type II/IV secretion system ATPase subunit n=1 Tax=Pyrodictium abyssi TaxID=54256 RepID=A0ABN6ZL33_9CREN|nr:type II/IV secretion system ATPase subunit [Pyrodictium abyssi]
MAAAALQAAEAGELRRLARRFPHLARYLRAVAARVGVPAYYGRELPRSLRKAARLNVMYVVDEEAGIFIHIYTPPGGGESGYRKYVAVEPERPPRELFALVEEKLASVITENDVARDLEERRRILLRKLGEIAERVPRPVDYRALLPRVHSLRRVPVYQAHYRNLVYYLLRDKAGLGILEPVLKDPYIEDISCPGVGNIYIVHKVFGPLETSLRFETHEELDKFIIELSERIGKPVSHARPIVDATLPDGSRINIVFGTDVSLQGSNFTIRRVAKIPLSVTQLVSWNTFDERIAAYLWMLLLEGNSGFVSGETASGKTTTLNAIVAFINPTAKIVTIEDTAELNVPHPNWVRELTRDTGSPETSVTMFDLLKAALRQRPNYIIVGEIRGAEGLIAFQAMQTGHPVLATFHAASVERLVQRLTSPPINVPKSQLDNLNFVVIQSAVYREGVLVRRVLSVNEIMGYDPKSGSTLYVPTFTWDPVSDRFTFRGRGTSYLLEEKIGVKRGLSRRNMFIIYDELELRARIIRAMIERKVFNYYQVFRTLARIHALTVEHARRVSKEEAPYAVVEALEEALSRIQRGELIK